MSDDFLIRLRLESVYSMESNGHKMSLVTLINEEENRQLTFICDHYVSDQFQATGGNLAKIFDVQNKRFITVTCRRCGFTELYRGQSSDGWNVLDFLMGG